MKFATAHRGGLKWVAPAAIGLAVSLALGTSAQAGEIRTSKEETLTVYLVKYRANNTVHYNKKPVGMVRKVTLSQYLRSNPYVCTPSGFGQKSRCYTRGSLKRPNV
jgi:hypothetical protein